MDLVGWVRGFPGSNCVFLSGLVDCEFSWERGILRVFRCFRVVQDVSQWSNSLGE